LIKILRNFTNHSSKLEKEIEQPSKLKFGIYNGLDHGRQRVFLDDSNGDSQG